VSKTLTTIAVTMGKQKRKAVALDPYIAGEPADRQTRTARQPDQKTDPR